MPDDKPHAAATPPGALPPDNGVRAWVDEKTGEVRGSGVGVGGGSAGEDMSSDSASADGPPENGIEPEKPAR